MATIKHVEAQIERIEGLRVRIRYTPTGKDVRSDKTGIPGYSYRRQMPGSKNVKDWRVGRFARLYPGYAVEVLTNDDDAAHGGTLLSTLRDA